MTFLQKKAELKEFWVDYFKFEISRDKNKKFTLFWLSANSDFFVYDEFTNLYWIENWTYDTYIWIMDKKTNVKLGFFLINKTPKKQGDNYLKDYIEITWQGLILRDLEYYYKMIDRFKIKVDRVDRVDIASDYITNTDELCKTIFLPRLESRKISYRPYITRWVIETLYIGKKEKKQNPYQLIRIYNKKLDSKVKEKSFLYDFDKNKDYTRIELEIRQDKAKYINYLDLLSHEYCFVVFAKAIHRFSFDFFKKFTFDDYKNISKLIPKWNSLYFDRIEKIKTKEENFIKYGKDFISNEEEQSFLEDLGRKTKRMIKNKYSFRRFLFNIRKFWGYENEIDEYFNLLPNEKIYP